MIDFQYFQRRNSIQSGGIQSNDNIIGLTETI